MARFKVKINTDSAAFGDDDPAFADDPTPELARILRRIAEQLETESFHEFRTVYDVNGNAVGRYTLRDEDA